MCNFLIYQADFPLLSPKEGVTCVRAFYGTEDPLSAQKWLANFIHWADQHNLSTMNMLKYAVTALFGDARDWFQGLGEVATWRDFWFLFREKFLQETAIWTGTIVLDLLQTKQKNSLAICVNILYIHPISHKQHFVHGLADFYDSHSTFKIANTLSDAGTRCNPYRLYFSATVKDKISQVGIGGMLWSPTGGFKWHLLSQSLNLEEFKQLATYEALIAGLNAAFNLGVRHIIACGQPEDLTRIITEVHTHLRSSKSFKIRRSNTQSSNTQFRIKNISVASSCLFSGCYNAYHSLITIQVSLHLGCCVYYCVSKLNNSVHQF